VSQARFQKMQREKAQREKAAAKRDRRAARVAEAEAAAAEASPTDEGDQQRVLAELAALHDSFEAGTVEFDDYEDRKRELIERLSV
jgi:hypothetical protein